MKFTPEELALLNNYLNGQNDLPVDISELNERIRAVVSPIALQPEAPVEEQPTPVDTESVS